MPDIKKNEDELLELGIHITTDLFGKPKGIEFKKTFLFGKNQKNLDKIKQILKVVLEKEEKIYVKVRFRDKYVAMAKLKELDLY